MSTMPDFASDDSLKSSWDQLQRQVGAPRMQYVYMCARGNITLSYIAITLNQDT